MGSGGALLQTDELLRRAGLLPVDGVGVGDVDRCRHGHLRVLPGQLLDQLDVLEIERHAGVDMGIADLDHAWRTVRAAELDQTFQREFLGRTLAAGQHFLFDLGQDHPANSTLGGL